MTDEQRLHGMMADPGPAPEHDANGWPPQTEPPATGDRVRWFEARGFRWMHGTLIDGPRDDQGRTRVRLDDGTYWYPFYENLSPDAVPATDADGRPLMPWVDMTERPRSRKPDRSDCAGKLFEDQIEDGVGSLVYAVACVHGGWRGTVAGTAIARAERWHGFADTTTPPTRHHAPDLPTDSAGPASSSASTGGTGGLAELLARLQAEVQSLAGMAQAASDELEGRRRELWDSVQSTARLAEIGGGEASTAFAAGVQYSYYLVTGLDGLEIQRLLAPELDSRYGKDRAKGGGPS